MDEGRKYRQPGYFDTGRDRDAQGQGPRTPRDRPKGPRLPIDVTGPRLPRLVQAVTASRCHNCAVTLPPDTDFTGACPKCGKALHCCKQCAHFESSTRFQCRKPVPVRIALKDAPNECSLFSARVTVARDQVPTNVVPKNMPLAAAPHQNPRDARAAFDSLFKKSE
jgi:hypothetical protein